MNEEPNKMPSLSLFPKVLFTLQDIVCYFYFQHKSTAELCVSVCQPEIKSDIRVTE